MLLAVVCEISHRPTGSLVSDSVQLCYRLDGFYHHQNVRFRFYIKSTPERSVRSDRIVSANADNHTCALERVQLANWVFHTPQTQPRCLYVCYLYIYAMSFLAFTVCGAHTRATSVIRRVSNNCNLPHQSLIISFLQQQNNSTASLKAVYLTYSLK